MSFADDIDIFGQNCVKLKGMLVVWYQNYINIAKTSRMRDLIDMYIFPRNNIC